MHFFYKRILPVCLAILLAASFTGCRQNGKEEQTTGIQVEQDPLYSAEVLNDAEQTIYALVLYTYRNAVMDKISEKVEARLARYAHRIGEILASKPIPEAEYRSVIALLEQNGEGVVDELLALRAGESKSYEKTRMFYLNLTYAFGAEQVTSMLYDFCLMLYDAKYEQAVERYETYQYPWYLEEADALAAERLIFSESVGKQAFSALVRCSTAMAELLVMSPEGVSQTLSNAEMLEIIRHLDLSEIDICEDGWELLLSHLPDGEDGSYFSKLITAFKTNGDISNLAAVMNDAVKLSVSVMEHLLPEDVDALRAGDWSLVLDAVCPRFDEGDWELFATVTSVSFANEQYSALAKEEYGEAYSEYLASIEQIDVSQLRASVDSTEFSKNLSNYLAGICPAISYEVHS